MDITFSLAEIERLQATIEQLQEALDSRVVIEQAKGVLAERFSLSLEEAFGLLRYSARASRRPLHGLAAEVVEKPDTPLAVAVGLTRQQRWRAAAQRERAEAHRESSERQRARAAQETKRARRLGAPPGPPQPPRP